MKCLHENFDDYFDKCTDCNATIEQVLQDEFKNELQTVFRKMQQALGIETGDIEPMQLAQLDEQSNKLAVTVADWLVSARDADTGDYAHCADCDRVIDLDNDLWTADQNDTYCEICTKERKIIVRI